MNVAEIMTTNVATCRAGDSLNRAAQLMWEHRCGALPVLDDDGTVLGLLTTPGDEIPADLDTNFGELVQNSLAALKTLRDEVRIDLNLAGREMRERWRRLEARLCAAEAGAHEARRGRRGPLGRDGLDRQGVPRPAAREAGQAGTARPMMTPDRRPPAPAGPRSDVHRSSILRLDDEVIHDLAHAARASKRAGHAFPLQPALDDARDRDGPPFPIRVTTPYFTANRGAYPRRARTRHPRNEGVRTPQSLRARRSVRQDVRRPWPGSRACDTNRAGEMQRRALEPRRHAPCS